MYDERRNIRAFFIKKPKGPFTIGIYKWKIYF